MIKVFVAEDEPRILKNLTDLLTRFNNVTVCGSADNGEAAIKAITSMPTPPDVLLTDIRMPIMDGLQLIKAIRELGLDIECIILSGFGEFEYAKTAMSYGITDYLLKPVKKTDLVRVMEEVNFKVTQRKLEQSIANPQMSSQTSVGEKLNIYMLLLAGNLPIQGCVDPALQDYWREFDLKECIVQCVDGAEFWVATFAAPTQQLVAVSLTDGDIEVARNICKKIYNNLQAKHVAVSMVYKMENGNITDIGHYAQRMQQLLRNIVVIGKGSIAELSRENFSTAHHDFEEMEMELLLCLKHNKLEAFFHLLSSTLATLQQEKLTQDMLWQHTSSLAKKISQQLGQVYELSVENKLIEAFIFARDEEELCEYVVGVLDVFIRNNINEEPTGVHDVIYLIDSYIEQNYTKELTSGMVAEYFHLSPTHLGRIFKNYKGMTPTEYITELRIAKAKTLLCGTNLTVKEVSRMVGYEDPYYFSKVFKRQLGISPSEYIFEEQ